MKPDELKQLIADSLNEFYKHRSQRLGTLKLKQILLRKNPYLYKALGKEKRPRNHRRNPQGILEFI